MSKQKQFELFADDLDGDIENNVEGDVERDVVIDTKIGNKHDNKRDNNLDNKRISAETPTRAQKIASEITSEITSSVRGAITDTQAITSHETEPLLQEIEALLIAMESEFESESESSSQPKSRSQSQRQKWERLTDLFKQYLQTLVAKRYFSHIDLYFSSFIAGQKKCDNPRAWLGYWLLLLLVSRAYGLGHTALPLTFLMSPKAWFIETDDPLRMTTIRALLILVFKDLTQEEGKIHLRLEQEWQESLSLISMPLIMSEYGIYLDRNYQQETEIIRFFGQAKAQPLTEEELIYLSQRLDHYFGVGQEINWQKFAAANALLNSVSVISGGPGTGKTTTVFKILQTLVDLHQQRVGSANNLPFTILLAAPTGKAAARLSESILGQVRQLQEAAALLDEAQETIIREQLKMIPYTGQTLHRLLMIHPFTRKPKFNRFNPLNFDLLVVDEASMIDQQMLVQLIGALPKTGRIIFLGDKDQLASVEAGAIMHELCVRENYSLDHFAKLTALLSEKLDKSTFVNPHQSAFNYLSFLKKSYRFKSDSALGHLAKLVNNEAEIAADTQYKEVINLLKDHSFKESKSSLELNPLPIEVSHLEQIIAAEFAGYKAILPHQGGLEFAEEAFKVFNQLGILSARRTGEYGALALNQLIRKTLFPHEGHREFFHGLPIMITHNSVENNLFNGDVGLILRNEEGNLSAYFEGVESARVFSIHALPKFEAAFAMTIHKSQGSEFERIMLFLGTEPSSFLTKELFYTGITRAKKSVNIFSSDKALRAALGGRVDRYSFIHERLSQERID